jgi:hypothetical protein
MVNNLRMKKNKKMLQEKIDLLQSELNQSLLCKSGNVAEINLGEHQRKLNELRLELSKLK